MYMNWLYILLNALGGGPGLVTDSGPSWTEITGVIIGVLSIVTTIIIFLIKRRGKP